MTATFYVGDAIEVMNKLPEKSVDLVLTSPPFLALRSYLPSDHPNKALEGGSQATPGQYIDWLIDVVEACDRVLAPHGSLCIELGDTYAGSGGAGGDYLNGLRTGQPAFDGSAFRGRAEDREYDGGASDRWDFAKPGTNSRLASGTGWPLAKSLSVIPELFRFTLVYGLNPLTGRTTERWRLRNVVRWVRPNPPVGALGDKFRPATSELMVFCKSAKRYFDLDAVREPLKQPESEGHSRIGGVKYQGTPGDGLSGGSETGMARYEINRSNPAGAPPLDWWNIPPGGYEGAHYAVFPPELCIKPIKAMCPEKVCKVCGQPSVRETEGAGWRQAELAAHIKERREALGLTSKDINGWFGYDEIAKNWERTDAYGARVPNFTDWPILKERLGLADEFDAVIRQLNGIEYLTEDGQALAPSERRTAYDRGGLPPSDTNRIKASRKASDRFTDCGHDDWRPGLVLDPFGGSGTTALVATGHGRDCILIDLDERNYELALQRVGPFILERAV